MLLFLTLLFLNPDQAAEMLPVEGKTWKLFDTIEDLNSFVAMDFDQDGNLFIVDFMDCQVVKISKAGEVLFSFGRKGEAPGEYVMAYDVAVDKKRKRVWVIDQIRRGLAGYDADGRLRSHLQLEMQPYTLAVRSDGSLIVGGSGEYNLALLGVNGKLVKTFGRRATAAMKTSLDSMLNRYMSITVDARDHLYVAYTDRPDIECYGPDLKLRWKIGRASCRERV